MHARWLFWRAGRAFLSVQQGRPRSSIYIRSYDVCLSASFTANLLLIKKPAWIRSRNFLFGTITHFVWRSQNHNTILQSSWILYSVVTCATATAEWKYTSASVTIARETNEMNKLCKCHTYDKRMSSINCVNDLTHEIGLHEDVFLASDNYFCLVPSICIPHGSCNALNNLTSANYHTRQLLSHKTVCWQLPIERDTD